MKTGTKREFIRNYINENPTSKPNEVIKFVAEHFAMPKTTVSAHFYAIRAQMAKSNSAALPPVAEVANQEEVLLNTMAEQICSMAMETLEKASAESTAEVSEPLDKPAEVNKDLRLSLIHI